MKVILINPSPSEFSPSKFIMPPLGLAYLYSALDEVGVDVKVIDADALGLTTSDLAESVKKEKPDIVGVTSLSPTILNTFETLKAVRPHTDILVLGGPHPTAVGGEVFAESPVKLDAVFYGESEESFPGFVKKVEEGVKISEISLPGMLLPGDSYEGKEQPKIGKLNDIPFPNRSALPTGAYHHPFFGNEEVATIITSRGCPYRCIFCDKHVCGSAYRARTAENVILEIEDIVLKRGVKRLIIYDDLFTLDKKRVLKICDEIINRRLKFKWKCESRVNRIDEEMVIAMKKAGCELIAYGVETVNEKGLEFLRKDITPDQVRHAFSITREAGIKSMGYFMLGIPGETMEDELKTVKFAIDLKADYAQFSVLSPFPGTDLFNYASEKGWVSYMPGRGPFEKGAKRPVLLDDYWTIERLDMMVRKAHRRFYFRPKYIFDRLMNISGPGEIIASGGQAVKLAIWWSKSTATKA
jgi:radical SAM superfamily enzyme YgiQ (UPF0313 family)